MILRKRFLSFCRFLRYLSLLYLEHNLQHGCDSVISRERVLLIVWFNCNGWNTADRERISDGMVNRGAWLDRKFPLVYYFLSQYDESDCTASTTSIEINRRRSAGAASLNDRRLALVFLE